MAGARNYVVEATLAKLYDTRKQNFENMQLPITVIPL